MEHYLLLKDLYEDIKLMYSSDKLIYDGPCNRRQSSGTIQIQNAGSTSEDR